MAPTDWTSSMSSRVNGSAAGRSQVSAPANSPLPAIGTVSTLRNWRTVLKLAEMCGC